MTRANSALWALPLLLLLPLLPLLGPDPAASAALPELQTRLSGVERLLGGFGRQLQQERPREEPEPEPETQPRAQERCPGTGGGLAQLRDAIIRTQDSLAAGASYLRAPEAVRGWRQCVAACCAEPRCSVAVVEQPAPPGSPAPPDAALGCYLFDCTARGRSVCRFAPHRGYSSYSLHRAPERGPGRPSPPLGKQASERWGWLQAQLPCSSRGLELGSQATALTRDHRGSCQVQKGVYSTSRGPSKGVWTRIRVIGSSSLYGDGQVSTAPAFRSWMQ